MSYKTDTELLAEAAVIAGESTPGANTKTRIAGILSNLTDSKSNKHYTYSEKVNNYTLQLADDGVQITVNKVTGVNITVPPDVFGVGAVIPLKRINTGAITVIEGAGVSVTGTAGVLTDPGLNILYFLECVGTNTWLLHNGSAIGVWTTLTTSPTGFGSFTTNDVTYTIIGKVCYVRGHWAGTGNATLISQITNLPATSRAIVNIPIRVINNATAAVGLLEIAAGSTTMTIYASIAGGNFTSTVPRSIFFNFFYEVQ